MRMEIFRVIEIFPSPTPVSSRFGLRNRETMDSTQLSTIGMSIHVGRLPGACILQMVERVLPYHVSVRVCLCASQPQSGPIVYSFRLRIGPPAYYFVCIPDIQGKELLCTIHNHISLGKMEGQTA